MSNDLLDIQTNLSLINDIILNVNTNLDELNENTEELIKEASEIIDEESKVMKKIARLESKTKELEELQKNVSESILKQYENVSKEKKERLERRGLNLKIIEEKRKRVTEFNKQLRTSIPQLTKESEQKKEVFKNYIKSEEFTKDIRKKKKELKELLNPAKVLTKALKKRPWRKWW
jgi:DNA repair exonuclease SbcCD ATPase subunit